MDQPGAFASPCCEPVIPTAPAPKLRTKGAKYTFKGEVRVWTGKVWHCEHKRERHRCKDCGGASICEHKRQRASCKDCGGSEICEHKRQRSKCKDCGGGAICEHKRRRSRCKDCGGASICEHKRQRASCKDCGGSGICEHKRQRAKCKDCGGASICEHKRQRASCKDCGGSGICEHKRERSKCKDCGGSGICEHKRQRSKCKDCGGASICEHKRHRSQCKDCGSSSLCHSCKFIFGTTRVLSDKTKVRYCADCFYKIHPNEANVPTRFKRKQHYIHERLVERYGRHFFEYDVTVQCSSSGKIPDWFHDCGHYVLNVECDEEQHKREKTSCEEVRLMKLFEDCGNRPFVCIRFNPDKYTDGGKKVAGCFDWERVKKKNGSVEQKMIVNEEEFKKRITVLFAAIDGFLDTGTQKEVELRKLFYDANHF